MAKLTCKVCGTEYSYCPNCFKHRNEPRWKISFCEENCKNIFDTLVKQTVGKISKAEARRVLSKLDMSEKSHFDADIQLQIDEIMTVEKVKNSEEN